MFAGFFLLPCRPGVHGPRQRPPEQAQGASFVPSPVMATSFPFACSLLINAILSSGFASARKSSTPAWRAIAAAVRGIVTGDHHRTNAHRAQMVETPPSCSL